MEAIEAMRRSIDATNFEYWQDVVCETILEGDCRNLSDHPFRAEISTLRPGDVWLSRVQGTGQKFTRSTRHIRRAQNEYFVLLLQLQGTTFHRQDGRDVVLRPGDIACNDTSRPFDLQLSDRFDQMIVHVPRTIAAAALGPTQTYTSRVFAPQSPIASLLSPFLRWLPQAVGRVPVPAAQQLMHICGSLVLTSLAESSGVVIDDRRWSGKALRHRAQVYIAAHAHEHTLNAEAVAHAVGVSLRRLQELFRDQGTTPSDYLWSCRLRLAQRDLADPLLAAMSICDIAMRSGFQSLAHFSRRFRQATGLSPSEFRNSQLRK